MINIVHFSTTHTGGAGIAARRLNQSLNANGISSIFVALENGGFDCDMNEISISRSVPIKIKSAINSKIQGFLSNKVFFSLFSVNVLEYRKILENFDSKNTVLHFHNWFNLVSQKELIRLAANGYRVVITLHDERFLTGGCHYAIDCKKFESGCESCPKLLKGINLIPHKNLTKVINQLGDTKIQFIAPSLWIKNRAATSLVLQAQNVHFISNTLGEIESFATRSKKQFEYRKSDLTKKWKVGVASMDPNSFIKGSDLIVKLVSLIRKNGMPIEILFMKEVSKKTGNVTEFWNKIDCLLVLSRADNSPNVIHEAKSYGLPVVASTVGGITELLNPNYDVALDLNLLSPERILELITLRLNISNGHEFLNDMLLDFNEYTDNCVTKHIELYSDLIVNY